MTEDAALTREVAELTRRTVESVAHALETDLLPCGKESVEPLWAVTSALLAAFGNPTTSVSTSESAIFLEVRTQQLESFANTCQNLKDHCDIRFRETHWKDVNRIWRRLYVDAVLVLASVNIERAWRSSKSHSEPSEKQETAAAGSRKGEEILLQTIRLLDLAIIVAGAPGRGRHTLVLSLISIAQRLMPKSLASPACDDNERPAKKVRLNASIASGEHLSSNLDVRAYKQVAELATCPDLEAFVTRACNRPFVVRGYARDWPALQGSENELSQPLWESGEYLLHSIAGGRGRVVPVELGKLYTDEDWGQQIMPWEELLARSGWNVDDVATERQSVLNPAQMVYLAQHTLLQQMPALERDLQVPDIVFAQPPAPSYYPSYKSPVRLVESDNGAADGENEVVEDLIKSVWIGPAGTISPAHTDPYYNCYVQVVGKKLVWIAPPTTSTESARCMYPYGQRTPSPLTEGSNSTNSTTPPGSIERPDEDQTIQGSPSNPPSDAGVDLTSLMTNTSRVDVFGAAPTVEDETPLFTDHIEPKAMYAVLQQGDLLFMPPGWWHGMKSLTRSFSVSMWF